MTGIFALSSSGKVVISHHFLFDMRTPFQPVSSNQFIMLTDKHTMDNAVVIDPVISLAFPSNAYLICYPSWSTLAAAVNDPAVCATSGPERHFWPFIPMLPAWLAAILMESGSKDTVDLCIITIRTIHDFDMCMTSSSPTKSATVSQDDDNLRDDGD